MQQFSAEGRPLLAWGDKGTEPGGFGALQTPYSKNTFGPIAILLAVDSQGHLYVADAGNQRIQKVDIKYPLKSA